MTNFRVLFRDYVNTSFFNFAVVIQAKGLFESERLAYAEFPNCDIEEIREV